MIQFQNQCYNFNKLKNQPEFLRTYTIKNNIVLPINKSEELEIVAFIKRSQMMIYMNYIKVMKANPGKKADLWHRKVNK